MPTSTLNDQIGPVEVSAWLRGAVGAIESEPRLDLVAGALSGLGRRLAASPLGPTLRGEVIGHSPHPTITTVRIGVLGSSLVAGVIGGRSGQKVAARLAAIGVAMSVPAAATAAVEVADEEDVGTRRIAAVYALANAAAGLLFFRRWLSRARGHGFVGVLWGLLGAAPLGVAAYLGGHLTGARGFASGPRRLAAPAGAPVPAAPAPVPAAPVDTASDAAAPDAGNAPHSTIHAV